MTLMNLFGLSEEQRMMREGVLALCERHLPWDRVRKMDEAREFPHEAYQALAEAGYLGLFYPEHLGGTGGSHKDLAILLETLGYYYTGIAQAHGSKIQGDNDDNTLGMPTWKDMWVSQ